MYRQYSTFSKEVCTSNTVTKENGTEKSSWNVNAEAAEATENNAMIAIFANFHGSFFYVFAQQQKNHMERLQWRRGAKNEKHGANGKTVCDLLFLFSFLSFL